MKRFSFRLQKVLNAREIAEREAQRQFSDAQCALADFETKRDAVIEELNRLRDQQRDLLSATVTAGTAMQHHRWQHELEKRVRALLDKCREAELEVAKRRRVLLDATKERKVIARLKERKSAAHDQLVQSEQQAILDDIGGRTTPLHSGAEEPYAGRES